MIRYSKKLENICRSLVIREPFCNLYAPEQAFGAWLFTARIEVPNSVGGFDWQEERIELSEEEAQFVLPYWNKYVKEILCIA